MRCALGVGAGRADLGAGRLLRRERVVRGDATRGLDGRRAQVRDLALRGTVGHGARDLVPTPVVCAVDRRRGCEVCRCDDAPGVRNNVYRPGEPAQGGR